MSRKIGPDHNGGPSMTAEPPASMSGDGWVAVRRELRGHYLVGFGKPVEPANEDRGFCYSRAEAWIDLIMECRYKDGVVWNAGKRMELKAGQLTGARSWLAHRWNWTPKTVRYFLDQLEEEGMIERTSPGVSRTSQMSDGILNESNMGQQRGKQAQVLTICNYLVYQFGEGSEGPAPGLPKGQQGASKGPARGQNLTKEQGNNLEDTSEPDASDAYATRPNPKPASEPIQSETPRKPKPYPDDFEAFWSGYPDKTNNSKSAALAAWKQLTSDDRVLATRSLPQFARYCRDNPTYRALHAERYLRQKRFEAHLTNVASGATYASGESVWWSNPKIVASISLERWKKAISLFANGVWLVDKLGPPPNDPGCVIPNDLLDELGLKKLYDAGGRRIGG